MSRVYHKLHQLSLNISGNEEQAHIIAEFSYERQYDYKGNEVPEINMLKFRFRGTDIPLTDSGLKTLAIGEFIKAEQRYIRELTGAQR